MWEVYLDNSATSRPIPEVIEYMTKTLIINYGNPSSLHKKGIEAEKILKKARALIAKRLNVLPEEIIFTSGGTESNNLAIKGIVNNYSNRGKHLITTVVEHPAVLNTYKGLEKQGFEITYLDVDDYGLISLKDLENSIRPDTILVSIMHINNELGTIEPVHKAGKLIKKINHKTFFHVDAVQSFGKILINTNDWLIDLLTISAHKFHGPKGVGALYKNKKINLQPLLDGGGQENNIRSGTENIPSISGAIPALNSLENFTAKYNFNKKIDKLKRYLRKEIEEKLDKYNYRINTPEKGAPHILNISFAHIKGEVLVHALEEENIFVSTGSACSSRKKDKSNVLNNINLPEEYINGTIRISLCRFNTYEEIDYTLEKLKEKLEYLSLYLPKNK